LPSANSREAAVSGFAQSAFAPVVLGFFGLGTGYLIYGPAELLRFPPSDPRANRALGVWGLFLPGLCQVVTGVILFVGLTWFQVFSDKVLYVAALAFSAYGIHWFALGWNRFQGNDPRPNAGMSVAFMTLSALGAYSFFYVGGWPVGVLFVGLFLVYLAEFFLGVGAPGAERALGLAHLATGLWLMYLTVSTTLNIALGYHWPGG
jgi:hypothetical protein